MSAISDKLELDIVNMVNQHKGELLPNDIPLWMKNLGIAPKAKIIHAERIGQLMNKTDVIIRLENSEPIKISAKLCSADYFGNWYGHKRFLEDFGEAAFYRMTMAATNFANCWCKLQQAAIFVGVSICFGKRTGNTALEFTDVFSPEDMLKICMGDKSGDGMANCIYVSNISASSISELIYDLEEITIPNINNATQKFKIAFRPINPMTERTNRGKNVYSYFLPYKKLKEMTIITDIKDLVKLGKYVETNPNCLNHNHVLDMLETDYNIKIPRKNRT